MLYINIQQDTFREHVCINVLDPDWIRIQSGQWIRIRNLDPDPGGQKGPTKVEKNQGISCFEALDVLF